MTDQPVIKPQPDPGPENNPDAFDLRSRIAKGAGWTVFTRLSIQGIGMLSILILARLLVPGDFGLIAIATAFSGALMAMSEFGFDTVLIQNQQATRQHYDTAWTMSVMRNSILAVCLVAGAESLAGFFNDPRLEAIIYCIAVGAFVEGLENIGVVNFRKNMAFHKDMIYMAGGKLGAFIITITLAFMWRDYWALVAGIVAGGLVKFVLSYIMQSYRPKFDLTHWREIMNFSKWLILQNIVGFIYNRADTFIIGKMIGASSVGLYTMSLELSQMATSNLVSPLRRALFPAYSKVSNDIEALGRHYVDIFAVITLMGTPVALGIGLVAEPLVTVMLGNKWVQAIPLLQILSLYGFICVISAGSSPIYLAMARPYYLTWITSVGCVILIPFMIVGVKFWGAEGAAWALTATTALIAIADFTIVLRLLKLPLSKLMARAWRPVIAAAAMALAVTQVIHLWPTPIFITEWTKMLSAAVAVGVVVYPTSVLLLWWITGCGDGAERDVLKLARKAAENCWGRMGRLRRAKAPSPP